MIRAIASATALVSVLSVAGCATEVGPEPGEARLELGTGSWRFEQVQDGDPVELVAGAQGGYHVWVSLRTEGVDADNVALRLRTGPADESRPMQVTELDELHLAAPDREGFRSYLGWPALLADPGCLVGEMLYIEATVTDPEGNELTDELYLLVEGGDFPPSCG